MRSISPALLLALAGSSASAQTLWANASGGLWGTPANWSPADVPNTSGEQARFNLPGVYQVDVGSSVTVGGVEIFSPDATVALAGGVQLSIVNGLLVNEGALLVNITGGTTDAILALSVDTAISGAGELRLNGAGTDARVEVQSGATLTNLFPHVIRGRGRLLGIMNNQGTIVGDVPGQDLEISFQVDQSGMGECVGDGGNIGLQSGARINSGVLRTANGGVWRTQNGSSIINGVTNLGDGQVSPGTVLRLDTGGIVNNGTILVNHIGTTTDAVVEVYQTCTHSGTGVMRLNGADRDAQLTRQGDSVLTNEATIAGRGNISAPIINEGLIVADNSGQVLVVNGPIVQTASGVCRGADGLLGLSTFGSVTGGVLETSGAGRWQARAGAPDIDAVTNTGVGEVLGGAALDVLAGGVVNEGEIVVNPIGSSVDAVLNVPFSATVSGDGSIRLNGAGLDAQLNVLPGATLVHGASHEIVGRGRITGSIDQRGALRADSALSPLEVAATLDQSLGGACVGDGGVLALVNGGSVIGGFFTSANSGSVQALSGVSTVSGVTNSGDMAVAPGAVLNIDAGGLTNDGVCVVNTIGSSTDAAVNAIASCGLTGTGRVTLRGSDLDAQMNTLNGAVINHGALHTIGGRGRLAAEITNEGTIVGDDPVGPLFVNGSITQTSGGVITSTVGTLRLADGAAVSGGLITGPGPGSTEASGGVVNLADLTITGTFNVQPGASVLASGVIVNNGVIRINPTASPTNAAFGSGTSLHISGAGEVILQGFGLDAALVGTPGAPVTLGVGQTLRGLGTLVGNTVIEGTLAPGLSVGTLGASGAVAFASSADVEIEVNTAASFDRVTGSGEFVLAGEVHVTYPPSHTPSLGDRLPIIQGSSVSGRFDALDAPDLGGIEWKLVYFPNKVELQVRCKADLSGSSDPNDPAYGIPDGFNDASDFFYYLDLFVASDSRADLTGSSDPNDPSYGIKDGTIDASDFFFFLDIFVSACG